MGSVLIFITIFLIIFGLSSCLKAEVKKFPLRMPNVYPNKDEFYVCTPVKVLPDKNFYIVGFEPNATMDKVHHMLLFGCPRLALADSYWDCGEMAQSDSSGGLAKANPCADRSHILYAWARDAKTLKLPEDVGFQVGRDTEIKYLVLQIHYAKKFPDGLRDNSGLFLMYTEEPQSKLAGVILLGTGGYIEPNTVTHMETSCPIVEPKTIHPFAYRTHTHSLGRAVSGYSVRRDENGVNHWTLLGKRDPLTPQMFYPVFNEEPISIGDTLAARCTMDSTNRNRITEIGSTNEDEMCNFYLMYYVENATPLEMKYCISEGPPSYYWKKDMYLNNIPNIEASSLD